MEGRQRRGRVKAKTKAKTAAEADSAVLPRHIQMYHTVIPISCPHSRPHTHIKHDMPDAGRKCLDKLDVLDVHLLGW